MSTIPDPEPTGPAYPLPGPLDADDPRFRGLPADVGNELRAHGYPPLSGEDRARLARALLHFLYALPPASEIDS